MTRYYAPVEVFERWSRVPVPGYGVQLRIVLRVQAFPHS